MAKHKGEYEKAKIEMRKEVERIKHGDDTEREKLESIAEKLKIDYTNKTDSENDNPAFRKADLSIGIRSD